MRIYYGTDRMKQDTSRSDRHYGSEALDSLQFGSVDVNVPSYRRRTEGEILKAPFWRANRFVYKPNSERDMFIVRLRTLDEEDFEDSLLEERREGALPATLVFGGISAKPKANFYASTAIRCKVKNPA